MKMTFRDIANKASADHMEDYLSSLGLSTRKPFRCLNPTHEDLHPSMSYWKEGHKCKCFSCGAVYDLFDLIGLTEGITEKGLQLKRASELFPDIAIYADTEKPYQDPRGRALGWNDTISSSVPPTVLPEDLPELPSLDVVSDKRTEEQIKHDRDIFRVFAIPCPDLYEAWSRRGISKETVNRYKLGYDGNYSAYMRGAGEGAYKGYYAPVLTIPRLEAESIGAGVLRNLDPSDKKQRYQSRGPNANYNLPSLNVPNYDVIFVTEGEIDGLSLAEIGYHNFVSLGNSNMTDYLLDVLNHDETITDKSFIILADNDEPGRKAGQKLKEGIEQIGRGLSAYYPEGFFPDGIKDPNEYLTTNREGFENRIRSLLSHLEELKEREAEQRKEEYIQNYSVVSFLDEYKSKLGKAGSSPIYPTSFPCFDEVFLEGGLHGGSLITIGALSSAGKTTITHQIADQIAEKGVPVMFFSLEMSKEEIVSKSISRLTYMISQDRGIGPEIAKTLRGITDGARYGGYSNKDIEVISDAVEYYERNIARNMVIVEGMGDVAVIPSGYEVPSIREHVEQCVNDTRRKPVVIVDYLQILAPTNERMDDKRSTDKNVLELKRIARDFDVPVIIISSMNRDSYDKEINLTSYKESGAIEYSSDVLLGLQFLGQSTKIKKTSKTGKVSIIRYSVDIDEAKQASPRKMELRLLKNRNGSMSISTIYFDYHPQFNYFKETGLDKPYEILSWEAWVSDPEATEGEVAPKPKKSRPYSDPTAGLMHPGRRDVSVGKKEK